jgi:hypothetical protein
MRTDIFSKARYANPPAPMSCWNHAYAKTGEGEGRWTLEQNSQQRASRTYRLTCPPDLKSWKHRCSPATKQNRKKKCMHTATPLTFERLRSCSRPALAATWDQPYHRPMHSDDGRAKSTAKEPIPVWELHLKKKYRYFYSVKKTRRKYLLGNMWCHSARSARVYSVNGASLSKRETKALTVQYLIPAVHT